MKPLVQTSFTNCWLARGFLLSGEVMCLDCSPAGPAFSSFSGFIFPHGTSTCLCVPCPTLVAVIEHLPRHCPCSGSWILGKGHFCIFFFWREREAPTFILPPLLLFFKKHEISSTLATVLILPFFLRFSSLLEMCRHCQNAAKKNLSCFAQRGRGRRFVLHARVLMCK